MASFIKDCPRCGLIEVIIEDTLLKCSKCQQYLYLNTFSSSSSSSLRIINNNEDNNNNNQLFALPYHYNRSLINIPSLKHKVSSLLCINQSVIDYIRYNFIPRDNDVWLATYPKAGTTWMQNILSYILYNEPNSSSGISVGLTTNENIVWFEAQCIPGGSGACETDSTILTEYALDNLNRINSKINRRCFKTHSHLGTLEPLITSNGKIIHVARNPKDVAVSMWHHTRSKSFGYDGPFDHFIEKLFLPGEVESGNWWEYEIPFCAATKRWNETKLNPDLLTNNYTQIYTVWYEDLKVKPVQIILEIAEFLECPITEEKATEISMKCDLKTMKLLEQTDGLNLSNNKVIKPKEIHDNNNSNSSGESHENQNEESKTNENINSTGDIHKVCSSHIREGKVGGYKKYFNDELLNKFNEVHLKYCNEYNVKELNLFPEWIYEI